MKRMHQFRDLSIRSQLRWMILISGAAGLVLAGLITATLAQRWSRAEAERELLTLASLISEFAGAALQREDPAGSQRLLDTLRLSPAITVGVIYRDPAGVFAQFRRSDSEPLPDAPLAVEGFHTERFEMVKIIRGDSAKPLGLVYLRADAGRHERFVRDSLAIVTVAVLGAMALGLLLATRLEQFIIRPIRGLVETADQVQREENFALRAPAAGQDELGQLVNAFNEMLTKIQVRDTELRQHRDHLGELIAQRTAELTQSQRALLKARDRSEDANTAHSTLLANMGHELRTPLTAIIGFSEILMAEAQAGGQPEALPDLLRICTAGRNLLALINDVLDLAKLETGKLTLHQNDFDLAATARGVVDSLRSLAEKNQNHLELEAPAGGLPMHADQTKVRQTLFNLLGHAIKFTDQGEIRLHLQTEVVEGQPWVIINLSDTGVGLSEERQAKLAKAFAERDLESLRTLGGNELGLVICLRFTEAMGGQLSAASRRGEGATFTVRLPARPKVAAQADEAPRQPPASVSVPSAELRTVLVIDDDPNTRDLMVRFLLKEGFSPHTAANGQQAMEMARRLHPALITLDVMMPEVDGWSVLGALKEDPDLAGIPVIMVTITEERDRGFTLGASEFLTKPVDFPRLASLVREYCPSPDDRPILVVEDDEISRHLLRRNLEKEGYPVALAANGREALDILQMRLPSIILLDLMMPELDGFALVQAVRERRDLRDVPIVVLTAKDLTEEDRRRLTGGVAVILQKQTLSPEALQAELRAALAAHLPQR